MSEETTKRDLYITTTKVDGTVAVEERPEHAKKAKLRETMTRMDIQQLMLRMRAAGSKEKP